MNNIQIVKIRKIEPINLCNKIKNKFIEDNFHFMSYMQKDYVYHSREDRDWG